jgi:hypothetical protein
MDDLRGLTLTQPWATLIAVAATRPDLGKRVETRGPTFPCHYRGRVAIHAAQGLDRSMADCYARCRQPRFWQALAWLGYGDQYPQLDYGFLPRGQIVAVARISGAYVFGADAMTDVDSGATLLLPGQPERSFGDYTPGRIGLQLADIQRLRRPVAARGMLGLWRVPADVCKQVEDAL